MDEAVKIKGYGFVFGLVVTILVSLAASKTSTTKQLEFFRESASGYSVSAFFCAQSICYILESTVSVAVKRLMYSEWPFYLNCILLAYNSAAWGFFYSSWLDPRNVVTMVGFHMVFGSFFQWLFSYS